MQHITKLCADSLRSFTNDTYDIKLKASHAHELVAAFLGYKSKAALLADTKHPIGNLQQAEFIVFDPSTTDYANQRYQDFQYGHPTAYQLADCFRSTIRAEKELSEKIYLSFREVAIHIAEQYLNQRLKMWRINPSSIDWNIDGSMYCWADNGDARLTAEVNYITDEGERLRDSTYAIYLPRVAANLGYGTPKVEEIRYSGLARKIG